MTGPFLSFRTDTMDPSKLEPVLSRYLKYERLRWFRALLVPRLAVLLLTCWALTAVFHVLPRVALATALVLVGGTTAAVVLAEFWARQQLVRKLRDACH